MRSCAGISPYVGHSVILGQTKKEWQDADYVLGLFGENRARARHRYHQFVEEEIDREKRPGLIGGGLLRG